MHPAAALGVAAACLLGAALCLVRRDTMLRLATRLRGYGPDAPRGPRLRYQRGRIARRDMLAPVVFFVALGLLFLARALLTLMAPDP